MGTLGVRLRRVALVGVCIVGLVLPLAGPVQAGKPIPQVVVSAQNYLACAVEIPITITGVKGRAKLFLFRVPAATPADRSGLIGVTEFKGSLSTTRFDEPGSGTFFYVGNVFKLRGSTEVFAAQDDSGNVTVTACT